MTELLRFPTLNKKLNSSTFLLCEDHNLPHPLGKNLGSLGVLGRKGIIYVHGLKAQRSYTTTTITKASVNPWFISGFVDAEGSFMVGIRKMARVRAG